MAIASTTGLVDALRQHRILLPAQLDEMTNSLQGRFPDAHALAHELLQRGWLTAYQVDQLLQGSGAELLLGPYLLLDRLGEGGMGTVFKARHQLMDRVVALKVIRKEYLAHADAIERFRREIRLAAQLDHPHLVRAYDAAQVGDTFFLVMEHVEGTDLQRLVQKTGPLPVRQACAYIRQAALGLQHAAERGLVHRDIKPSNLQVTAQGTVVKVLDMGMARSMMPDGEPGRQRADAVAHAPGYAGLHGPGADRRRPLRGRADRCLQPGVYVVLPAGGAAAVSRRGVARKADLPPQGRAASHRATSARRAVWGGRGPAQNDGQASRRPLYDGRGGCRGPAALRPSDRPGADRGHSGSGSAAATSNHLGAPVPSHVRTPGGPTQRIQARLDPGGGCAHRPHAGVGTADLQVRSPTGPGLRERSWLLPAGGGAALGLLILLLILLWSRGGDADSNGSRLAIVNDVRAGQSGASGDVPPAPALARAPFGEARAKELQMAWAKYLGRKVIEAVDLGGGMRMEFVLIPPGTFTMGSPKAEKYRQDYEQAHEVTITRPFYLGKYAVTQEQYERLTGLNPRNPKVTDNKEKQAAGEDTRRFPVESMSWEDADACCAKLGRKAGRKARLPTEAQWEYACRAGTTTPFYFGMQLDGTQANCDVRGFPGTEEQRRFLGKTCPVGTYRANAWGLYDMHGNVWQWCADWYGPYEGLEARDPLRLTRASEGARMLRGGSWFYSPAACRAASRSSFAPAYRYGSSGCRVCLWLD